ncbi:MAG TPA: bifunctional diguanylate cyclase/phosphodiesterase, partial [Mariprofundaceae bacterium]|nr:bifunctional diguanylate cyclase/phosphodiesterase [Mariprofundaceae bacterium]
GYSNLRLLSDLEPEYVKLDKYFISRIDTDPVAEHFVRTIIALARRVRCRIIAEGIETPSQLQHVHRLGVDYAQGFLLDPPSPEPTPNIPSVLMEACPVSRQPEAPAQTPLSVAHDELVASLDIHPTPVCAPLTAAAEALALFQADPLLRAVPVLDGSRAVGLLTREGIFGAFALAYGHSLHKRSHVERMMHPEPLAAQVTDMLSDVSRRATARPHELIYAPIIIFDGEHYLGTAFIHDLLEKITEVQVNYALDANPLTGLPGNRSIDREVSRRLRGVDDFFLCHLDIDNFKAFNDHRGYERGDEMILLVSELLKRAQTGSDYVGHIGGDDFVFITTDPGWELRLQQLLDEFTMDSLQLYDEADRLTGFIRVESRSGQLKDVPLASLSVGALPCSAGRFSSHLEASAAVFEVKCLAKKQPGNCIAIDRRMD